VTGPFHARREVGLPRRGAHRRITHRWSSGPPDRPIRRRLVPEDCRMGRSCTHELYEGLSTEQHGKTSRCNSILLFDCRLQSGAERPARSFNPRPVPDGQEGRVLDDRHAPAYAQFSVPAGRRLQTQRGGAAIPQAARGWTGPRRIGSLQHSASTRVVFADLRRFAG